MSQPSRKVIISFILWNLCVFALWIWAREGSIVRLKFVVAGKSHTMYCDGKLVDRFAVNATKSVVSGRAGIGLSSHSRPPLVVRQQEFDDFVIRSVDDDRVLLQESFDEPIKDWYMLRGVFKVNKRGRLVSPGLAMGATGDVNWKDYSIEVTCYNPTESFIVFRVQDKKNYGRIKMRFWRELIAGYSYYIDGKQSFNRLKSIVEPIDDAARSLVLRFVKVYATACLILLGFLTLFVLISFLLRPFMGSSEKTDR